MKKALIFTSIIMLFYTLPAEAQCAMCRAVLESEEGQAQAEGINNGIVYLMAIPYILVAGIGILIYRNFRAKKN
ncbi:hypothetical protein SAMN04487989_1011061 [Bizionia echini]|uniref:Uncharacterized protein n=1 Tax=Bizionia echini TaxID=649333 RepID=A0A1I4ZTE1_9FLAO|nr:hypothetical protein [Bizionia echini]SFN53448.1 hypothetical protein SAMN04487989_1011061 [Bizionia echini]